MPSVAGFFVAYDKYKYSSSLILLFGVRKHLFFDTKNLGVFAFQNSCTINLLPRDFRLPQHLGT